MSSGAAARRPVRWTAALCSRSAPRNTQETRPVTLKLYYAPGACSFVPHTMLELAGATFEPVAVKLHKGEQKGPEYLALNPRGQVPVLADGGEVITQIVAIIAYIDAKFPESGFIPGSRWRAPASSRRWRG